MKYAHMVAFILMAAGGVAWGIYGLFGTDVIFSVLGDGLSRIVYVVVGVATVYEIVTHKAKCKECTV